MYVYDLHTMKGEESVSSPLSVALGNFDGVHLGHAQLIRECVGYAREKGIASAVWTFSDSAGELPNKPGVLCLTSCEEKLDLIASMGVDYAILEDFSAVRDMTPEHFVREHLIKDCKAVCAVCGYNFRFGAGGVGTCDSLRELMKPYDTIVVPPVFADGVPVSSTAIRALVENGDMSSAQRLLGRPFSFTAPVVDGKHLGRTMGIPTVNQNFPVGHVIPKKGIYACRVQFDGISRLGVANVGVRPTIANDLHKINCETHIIGFDGWLYGKNVKIAFLERLRDEKRFDSIEELKVQIECDIRMTLERCSSSDADFK